MSNVNIFFLAVPLKKKKLGKNPDVDTSFLPDREREVLKANLLCSFYIPNFL